jgi:hypothetical protein
MIGFIADLGLIDKLEAGAANIKTRGADFVLARPKQKHIFFSAKTKKGCHFGQP